MNIYDLVNNVCEKRTFSINTQGVQRLVGSLRTAGFADKLSLSDTILATQIVERRLMKLEDPRLRTADTVINAPLTPINSIAQFEEIDTFRSKNLCPRCKTSMEQVKLANYENAAFCSGCKVALWTD